MVHSSIKSAVTKMKTMNYLERTFSITFLLARFYVLELSKPNIVSLPPLNAAFLGGERGEGHQVIN